MTRSTMSGVLIGRDRRRRSSGASTTCSADFGNVDAGEDWFHEREPTAGSSARRDEARAQVERFAEAGAERIMLQDFLPRDLDMIDLMAEALF